jgi:hypothetical protein
MSSDKPSQNLPNKQSQEVSNPPNNFINPSNIDYSIIKNYYPNQGFPAQSYMNYPVDISFQQNQSYQPNSYGKAFANQVPNNDLRNIYYSNFTSQSNSTISVNPPKAESNPPAKQSNFSSFPPQNTFTPAIADTQLPYNPNNYIKDKGEKKEFIKTPQEHDTSRNYYNRSNNYQQQGQNSGFPHQYNSQNYNNVNNSYDKGNNLSHQPVKEEVRMDWICPVETCRNRNFAKRDKCNLCKTPKPVNPEYDNSEFPKRRKKDDSRSKSRSRSRKREIRDRDRSREKDREEKFRDKDKDADRFKSKDNDRYRERERERRQG